MNEYRYKITTFSIYVSKSRQHLIRYCSNSLRKSFAFGQFSLYGNKDHDKKRRYTLLIIRKVTDNNFTNESSYISTAPLRKLVSTGSSIRLSSLLECTRATDGRERL